MRIREKSMSVVVNKQTKRSKHPDPHDGMDRFLRNQTLWSQRSREANMWAVLEFQILQKISRMEKMCASAEYISDYDFHTKTRSEICDLKTTLAGSEREYHIKPVSYTHLTLPTICSV